MKHVLTFCLILSLIAALSGCMSHSLPKDTYMRGVKSKINTPWGSHELQLEEAATGTAAKNASGVK